MNTKTQTVTGERNAARDALKNNVVVKCHADGSWLSEFESNGRAIFRLTKSDRMILQADDPRLEPYFYAPYEVRDITVTPDDISEAYDIKNVDIRNLLTVVMGRLSNQTGESFDSALSRGKCADEILRRFKNAEGVAAALSRILENLKENQNDLPPIPAVCELWAEGSKALAAWEGAK